MTRVEDSTSPRFRLNHPFNTGLGIPITRQSDDVHVQGTLTFLFQEVKDSNGDPSNRTLALTNKHVASVDEEAVNTGLRDAVRLVGELEELESKAGGQQTTAIRRKQNALDDKNEDNTTLRTFSA